MGRAKIREHATARRLRQQGRSVNEIANELGVSKGSASVWVRSIILRAAQRQRLERKEEQGRARGRAKNVARWREYRKHHPKPKPNLKLLENRRRTSEFFDEWTPTSAYVLGYFAADGCMYHSRNGGFYNGGFYIEFVSTDRELLELVRKLMRITNKIEDKPRRNGKDKFNRKRQYKLRIVSKSAFERLLELGFSPAKSLTLSFPNVPKKLLHHFVRGYFDGDGCVYFKNYWRKDRGKAYPLLMVRFTCGSKQFLSSLQRKMTKATDAGKGSLHPHTTVWDLSYSTSDSRQLYKFMYPTATVPCLKRKRQVFKKAFATMDS